MSMFDLKKLSKNKKADHRKLWIVTSLIVLITTLSCSLITLSKPLLRLVDRTLIIDVDTGDFIYPHYKRVCEDGWGPFKKCKWVHDMGRIPFCESKEKRKELADKKFKLISDLRFDYGVK